MPLWRSRSPQGAAQEVPRETIRQRPIQELATQELAGPADPPVLAHRLWARGAFHVRPRLHRPGPGPGPGPLDLDPPPPLVYLVQRSHALDRVGDRPGPLLLNLRAGAAGGGAHLQLGAAHAG